MHFQLPLLLLALTTAPVLTDDPPSVGKTEFFGLTKVHSVQLTIQATDWDRMKPTKQPGFMQPFGEKKRSLEKPPLAPANDNPDRKPRGGFGLDFEYVKANLVIDGQLLKDVAVRYKGNSTYLSSQPLLKKPLKIDFDRYVEKQNLVGLKKLALGNLIVDASGLREALAYHVYRVAGVPAPRTAYASVKLTIPGQYDNELLGLYVLIEAVDKPFLKEHFGSAKGLLLKPEKVSPFEYLGEEWRRYAERYQAKTDVAPKQQRRLIELARLVSQGTAEEFRRKIGSYIDTDQFTRYLAATVLLSSMDSFIGLGHNYYLYLDPRTERFVILPWDCDHAFGGLSMGGPSSDLMDLSISEPAMGSKKFVERLFSDEKVYATYKGHLERLLKDTFTVDYLQQEVAAIRKVIEPLQEQERQALAARHEGQFGKGRFNAPPPMTSIVEFVRQRRESVLAQLEGKSKGVALANRMPSGPPGGFGPPGGRAPGRFLGQAIFSAADKNGDHQLTRAEAVTGARSFFRALSALSKGPLDQKALVAALDRLRSQQDPGEKPAPFGEAEGRGQGGAFRPRFGPSHEPLARVLLEKAGVAGQLTEDSLVKAVENLFVQADRDGDGLLDQRELTSALQRFLPAPPPFAMPFGPPGTQPPVAGGTRKKEANP